VSYDWLEECLKAGERLPEHKFTINYEEEFKPKKVAGAGDTGASNPAKRSKMAETSGRDGKNEMTTGEHGDTSTHVHEGSGVKKGPSQTAYSQSSSGDTRDTVGSHGTSDVEVYRYLSQCILPSLL
jgi:DNA polymerase lambda